MALTGSPFAVFLMELASREHMLIATATEGAVGSATLMTPASWSAQSEPPQTSRV